MDSVKLIEHELALELHEQLGSRHPAERAHGLECAALAERTATMLGLGSTAILHCSLGALLHDVGMLEIAPAIRSRLGVPSDAEWDTIATHPLIGERILRTFPALYDIAPIVRAHHERVDGSGYPDGLRGDAIPIEARIVAVVDAFHAMTTPLPFRRDFSADQAIGELLGNCGTQFDADAVEAFTAVQGRRARRLHLVASA